MKQDALESIFCGLISLLLDSKPTVLCFEFLIQSLEFLNLLAVLSISCYYNVVNFCVLKFGPLVC